MPQQVITIATPSGTWTAPSSPTGIVEVTVELWGGGGAGGGSNNNNGGTNATSSGGGGGGAGSYSKSTFKVTAGVGYTYNVGLGGNSVAGNNNGNNGGGSDFNT